MSDKKRPGLYFAEGPMPKNEGAGRMAQSFQLPAKKTRTVERLGEYKLDHKRFKLPVEIVSECPKCSRVARIDYFSYPEVNKPIGAEFYCLGCDTGWTHPIMIVLEVKIL